MSKEGQKEEYPPTKPYRSEYLFPKPAPARPAEVEEISLMDDYVTPGTLHVPAGMTVRWKNEGRHEHTVTSPWKWESGMLRPGKTYSLMFVKPGTYYYFCRMHRKDMHGVIVVY
jgi:plastocyanin